MKKYQKIAHFSSFFILGIVLTGCYSNQTMIAQETNNITQIGSLKLSPIEPKFRNQWTADLEKEFQKRAATIIDFYRDRESYGNAYGENEKRSYPAGDV